MAIKDALLPEFDQEMANTRKTLERVPDDQFDWAPHPKSMKLGRLAGHLAELTTWGAATIAQDDLELAPKGSEQWKAFVPASRQEVLDRLETSSAEFREKLVNCDDAAMQRQWRLLRNGEVMLAMPRYMALRSFVMNHCIHHRAQLGVYLRLLEIAVPSVYGPSADENPTPFTSSNAGAA